jgi:putative membrane protein
MVPIELTSRFFQALHPWLPLTWSIKATRIAMFDAYGGAWLQSIGAMVAMLGTALLVATLVGRWKAVEPRDYRPMLD